MMHTEERIKDFVVVIEIKYSRWTLFILLHVISERESQTLTFGEQLGDQVIAWTQMLVPTNQPGF